MANQMGEGKQSGADDFQQIIAPAFYPAKEAWKAKQGNRYTPEELRQMEEHWEVSLCNPWRPTTRAVD